nr:hypothetical protein [Bacteroidota bacterium]
DKSIYINLKNNKDVFLFDFDIDSLSFIDLIVSRAGLGIISDCVMNKIPIFYIKDINYEIQFNSKVIDNLIIGQEFNENNNMIDLINIFSSVKSKYQNSFNDLNKDGVFQFVSIIKNILNGKNNC